MKSFSLFYNLLLLSLVVTAAGCNDNYVSSIPNYSVSLHINLTTTYSTFKNSVNQCLYFDKRVYETDRIGYGGILICSGITLDDYGNTIYYAFDMACPYEADASVRVYPPAKMADYTGKVTCEKCGSVYDIAYGVGNPVSGPSKEILKKYKTSYSGDVLYIYR